MWNIGRGPPLDTPMSPPSAGRLVSDGLAMYVCASHPPLPLIPPSVYSDPDPRPPSPTRRTSRNVGEESARIPALLLSRTPTSVAYPVRTNDELSRSHARHLWLFDTSSFTFFPLFDFFFFHNVYIDLDFVSCRNYR